ncbi:MAG: ATP-binding protein [Phycisphaerales bacterium]|jgi:signal transduction histidine kinase|nr:ATP-binding protein [Phycisphaerales bacterium]
MSTAMGDIPARVDGAISPGELARLMSDFSAAASRVQETHEALTREVARLRAELHDKNEQLARSKRLAALGEMAAGIAHEVRNPLGSIGLYAKMLREDLAERPEQARLAERIGDAVRGLNAVVGDVLSFARDVRPEMERASLREIAGEAVESCIAGSALRERVRARVEGDARAKCDTHLLGQAIVNVVRNALDAMEEDGSDPADLVVEIDADASDGAGMALVRVRDSGPGVSDEVRERMFNPFFTTRRAGTGLGLAIVHRIVDAHGGWVRVERNAETGGGVRGTCVTMALPAHTDEENEDGDGGVVVARARRHGAAA